MTFAKKPLSYLDFVILSFIFFGFFSYSAIEGYLSEPAFDSISETIFSEMVNWWSILIELCFLGMAGLYLWWQKFDIKLIPILFNKKTLPLAIALALIGALTSDLIFYGGYWLTTAQNPFISTAIPDDFNLLAHISLALLAFALMNGFYEELFFMGLTMAVQPKYRLLAIITSLFVRFIFHIYQGLLSAFAIAVVGLIFILLRQKIHSIVPFVLAHAVFDVFGAGVIGFLI